LALQRQVPTRLCQLYNFLLFVASFQALARLASAHTAVDAPCRVMFTTVEIVRDLLL
jgi:hypothetical protein